MRSTFVRTIYRYGAKPVLFRCDPERVHDFFTSVGYYMGSTPVGRGMTRLLFDYQHPSLHQTIGGNHFSNPIGIAGGFDKNGYLASILPSVGFGFLEVGSVTARRCAGNARPRLWRLEQEGAIVVNYGLANQGAGRIAQRLRRIPRSVPVGVSVALTNRKYAISVDQAIAEYVEAVQYVREVADHVVVNISCPNTCVPTLFDDIYLLKKLLCLVKRQSSLPVFVKISPDKDPSYLRRLVRVCLACGITGIICTNLTKSVVHPYKGGVSGQPLKHLSYETLRALYRLSKGKLVLVSCGGVDSGEEAYRRIRCGASLVQLITGMIYQGPQLIGTINKDLVRLLHRDGFSSISQAVGKDN